MLIRVHSRGLLSENGTEEALAGEASLKFGQREAFQVFLRFVTPGTCLVRFRGDGRAAAAAMSRIDDIDFTLLPRR